MKEAASYGKGKGFSNRVLIQEVGNNFDGLGTLPKTLAVR